MKDIEIELKLFIKEPKKLLEWLRNKTKFINEFKQTDHYFDPPHRSFIYNFKGYKDADEWFRIRFGDKGNAICYKKWHRDKYRKSLYCDEIETDINDAKTVMKMLKIMNFKSTSVVKKKRQSFKYGDFRFDCDEIEGLGFFLEVEFRGEIKDPKLGRQKIIDFLAKIGVENYKIINGGYPWMQWNQGKKLY